MIAMPFISVRNIQIYYEIHGTGPPLLSISGTGGDLRRSPNIFEMPLAQHFKILAYDQRGLGQTSRPDIPCSMADYADDADGLLSAIGWDSCPVIGISFGGMVAQEFTLRYPHRVERLVLACTSSGGAGGTSYPLHQLVHLSLEERARRMVILSDTRRDAKWRGKNPYQFQELVEQTVEGLRVGSDEQGRQAGLCRQFEARSGHDTYDRLVNLHMPVYICGGRYDSIAPPTNLEAMNKQIPGARLELFEGGHLFFIQDPHAFKRITAFLRNELDD